MKPWICLGLIFVLPLSVRAESSQHACLSKKYDTYVDASLQWYQDLVHLTVQQQPKLHDVGDWFLQGRKHHFELNRTAVHYFIRHEPSRVATERSLESWLQLSQADVKQLAERNDELGLAAQRTFHDRQTANHSQNYQLRSAFAELLSHPKKIEGALKVYNRVLQQAQTISCH